MVLYTYYKYMNVEQDTVNTLAKIQQAFITARELFATHVHELNREKN